MFVGLLNIGNNDEDKVRFQILNSQLGINIENIFGGLRALPNEPESRFSKVYSFNIPKDIDPGDYPLTLRVTYDDDRKVTEDSATLAVSSCTNPLQETTAKPKEAVAAQEESEVELITPNRIVSPSAQQPVPGATITQESPLKSSLFTISIIAAEVIAVLIGIVAVVFLFRRKG